MEKNKWVQPLSYHLTDDFLQKKFIIGAFLPSSWVNVLRIVRSEKKHIKLDFLGKEMLSRIPLTFSYYLSGDSLLGNQPWLFMSSELNNLENVKTFFVRWLRETSDMFNFAIEDHLLRDVVSEEIKTVSLSLLDIKNEPYFYRAISGYLVEEFSRNLKTFTIDSYRISDKTLIEKQHVFENVKFLPCFDGNTHKVITFPKHNDNGSFSYSISFKAEQIPDSNELKLHIKVHGVNYVLLKDDTLQLKYGKGASFYIGYLSKENDARLESYHVSFNKKAKKHELSPASKTFLKNRYGISFENLLENTSRFIHNDSYSEQPFAAFVYSPEQFGWIKKFPFSLLNDINSGISFSEKETFYRLISDTFPDLIETEAIHEVKSSLFKTKKYSLDGSSPILTHFTNPNAMNYFAVEIWSKKGILYSETIKWLDEMTQKKYHNKPLLDKVSKGIYRFSDSNEKQYIFEVKHLIPNRIDGLLEPWDKKKTVEKLKSVQQFLLHAKKEIDEKSDFKQQQVFTLFELERYDLINKKDEEEDDELSVKERDSYKYIRKAFLEYGRKIQFVSKVKEVPDKTRHEVISGVLDMLSKQGFHVEFEKNEWLKGFDFFGFDILDINDKKLPILSKVSEEGLFVYSFLGDKWLPFHQSNELVKPYYKKSTKRQKNELEYDSAFLLSKIKKVIHVSLKQKMLFLPASLRKTEFEFLRNGQWKEDEIKNFVDNINQKITVVRWNDYNDVADYYGKKIKTHKFDKVSKERYENVQGVYQMNHHLYYSIAQRGDQMVTSLGVTKMDNPESKLGSKRIMEFCIYSNDSEEIQDYACLSHHLRNLNVAFNVQTNRPFPLFMIESMKEYKDLI